MHSTLRHLMPAFLAALFFSAATAVWSQDPGSTPAPSAPTATVAGGEDGADRVSQDAVAASVEEPSVPATAGTSAPGAEAEEAPLRELGADGQSEPSVDAGKPAPSPRVKRSGSSNERVSFGQDITLKAGESADQVVAIGGSATIEGEVDEDVVAILGDVRVSGPVEGGVVAVLGGVHINSRVGGDVVAVMGDVELGPLAEVKGEVVAVGGAVERDAAAVVGKGVQNVNLGAKFSDTKWLVTFFRECVLKARPLAFSSDLAWAWGVAFGFLAFYVVLALLFRRGVEKCAETLETRPGYSVLAALLTLLLVPVAMVLLAVSVIGIALIPFLAAALFFASFFGKAVMLAWLGRRITSSFGSGPFSHVAVAVLLGGLIVMLLYVIPVFGFLLFKLLGWLGMGVVVYTLVQMSNRDRPAQAGMPPPVHPGVASVAPAAGVATGSGAVAAMGMAESAPAVPMMSAGFGAAGGAVPAAMPVVSASTYPRAGLMIRLGALLLDFILVGLVLGMTTSWFGLRPGPGLLPMLALYGALMWKLKGTTIGGIICGLKIVRIDDREIDWATAIVRALGCFLSLAVAGLGFIWIAIDDGRQSWHDKIAGTVVVRVPKGVSPTRRSRNQC